MKVRKQTAMMPGRTRRSLEPFSAAFESLLLPFIRQANAPEADRLIARLACRIRRSVNSAAGHPVHPALICYGLRLSCHYYHQAIRSRGTAQEMDLHQDLLDTASGAITKMEEYFGTYRLRLFLA